MKQKKNKLFTILSICLFFSISVNAQTLEDAYKNLNAERFTKAGELFTKIASQDPSQENLFSQGYFLLKTMDKADPATIKQAESIFSKAAETGGKRDALGQVGLGMAKLANKDFSGAKTLFEEAVKKSKGKNADVFTKIATAYSTFEWANDPAEAVLFADRGLDIMKIKDNSAPYLAKAAAYLIKNEGGDAMNALQNAERMPNANKADIYSRMARVWLQGKNYKEAEIAINKAIEADPNHAPAYRYQSSFYQTYQKWDESAEAASNYLKNSEGDCGAKLRYAKIAFIAKDYDNVLSTINDIRSCTEDPILDRLEGIAKFEKGDNKESIALLENYIKTAPKEEVYGLDYGYIARNYMSMHGTDDANDDLAIEFVEKAYAANDTTHSYYNDLAEMYKGDKDFKSAVTYLEKEIETKKNPSGSDYANLGIMYFQTQNWEKADPVWDKVCELYRDTWADAYVLSGNVKTYRFKGATDFPGAARYEKYLSLLTDEQKAAPANLTNMTTAYKALAAKAFILDKDNAKAIQLINDLKKYDPSNTEIDALLSEINGGSAATPATGLPETEN